ncbi:TonB-dependent receptor [Novosphingobium sp. FSY-8]|uniref:TonB-dependent receptor n=1 Tax=Novosphingobium ovatum TaxID=1908523 RepID=A0ABW9XCF5_9SPHN|nr:TonB-dependent receptor [Novosphingobium ovatum]NBC36180.1 TonB-dependent receptor [Novosphingobium ovatum]
MNRKMRFVVHTSLAAMSVGWAAGAHAQTAPAEPATAEIIVTGSSIKGVAPVGSNLTTVTRADLETTAAQTVQQVLKSVPAVVGLQAAGQGAFGSADGSGTNAPTIHGLGASASNSTLILMNGHRIPTSGINHVLADPNILAPIALERVEVLADGASSVYGSDAVAGVINFITRKNVNGFEANAQTGFGSGYHTYNAGLLFGRTFAEGSFLVAYNYSDRSNLAASSRSYTNSANLVPYGGRNNTPTRCAVPTIGGSTAAYLTYTPSGCDQTTAWDLLPSEKRHNVYAQLTYDVSDKLHLFGDMIYSNRRNVQNVTRGNASNTIYANSTGIATGRSVNPFALAGLGNNYVVGWNADAMFGPGATITGTAEDLYFHMDAIYDLSQKWQVNLGGVYGQDLSQQINVGQLNTAAFNLALNGYTSAAINGVNQVVSQTLTTANALDLWGNGTSAATKASLIDNRQLQQARQTMRNLYLKVSGDLFDLPAGAAKLAVGGELVSYKMHQDIVRGNGLGIASQNSQALSIDYRRNVSSAYAELYVPLIRDGFVKLLDLNISGRYDHYSDFGNTTNPKIALNFEPVRGVKFRANWARSFVAPALTSIGSNANGLTGESGFSGVLGSALPGGGPTLSLASFPTAASIPGAVCSATACTISNVQGVLITGGSGKLKPQKGEAWSVGVDLTPAQVPDLRVSVTYWSNKLRGGITAPQPSLALGSADLSYLMQIYPSGATATDISNAGAGLPQTGVINGSAYFIYNYQQANVLNLDVAGLDVSAAYRFTTPIGKFNIGLSFTRKLKFDQFFGDNGVKFSVLGTSGFNTTFPSVKTEGRLNVSYSNGAFDADVFVNHLGSYTYWGSSVMNPITRTNGVPTGGGDHVGAFTTVDLHLGYTLKNFANLREVNVYVDATNVFDKAPPFVNTYTTNGAVGYDGLNANPLGRVVNVGLRTKF